jgi:hypothetical protein
MFSPSRKRRIRPVHSLTAGILFCWSMGCCKALVPSVRTTRIVWHFTCASPDNCERDGFGVFGLVKTSGPRSRRSSGDNPSYSRGLEECQECPSLEGGKDPIVGDVAYYARRVGLDVETGYRRLDCERDGFGVFGLVKTSGPRSRRSSSDNACILYERRG